MKKLLLVSLGCVLAASASAQTEKGARFIGANIGELSYRKAKTNYGSSNFTVALYPSAGVFVANNFLLGANVPLGYQSYKQDSPSYDYSTSLLQYGLVLFMRYYVPSTSLHRFFGHLGGGVMWQGVRYPNFYNISDINGGTNSYGTIGAALGYNYFLTPGAALEITAGYTRNKSRVDLASLANGATGLFDIRACFSVFLPSKRDASIPAR